MADLMREIEKVKTWVELHKDEIKKAQDILGEGREFFDDFMKALLRGKPEAAVEALTEFADVNELVINSAKLSALHTGSDVADALSILWKGVVLAAKVAVEVAAAGAAAKAGGK